MAQLRSTHLLKGRVGQISYFKGKDGYQARDKRGIEGDRVRNDEAYARTRENAAEFVRAAKAMKETRLALLTILKQMSDANALNRLTKLFFRILRTDPVSPRGQRLVSQGDLSMLNGFQFNAAKDFKTVMDPKFYRPSINRETGQLVVSIDPFIPNQDLSVHQLANHFRFIIAGVEMDFENGVHTKIIANSGSLPINLNPTATIDLVSTLPANSQLPLILFFGVIFEDVVNGIAYPLADKGFNSLGVVAVDTPTE